MLVLFSGPSTEIDNKQRANSPAFLYSCGDTSCSICFPRMATFATGNQNERSTSNESPDSRKRKMPGSSDNPGMEKFSPLAKLKSGVTDRFVKGAFFLHNLLPFT